MPDSKVCYVCSTEYKHDSDVYCRNCGAKKFIENHCKSCKELCDLDDLFCCKCGSETEYHDISDC